MLNFQLFLVLMKINSPTDYKSKLLYRKTTTLLFFVGLKYIFMENSSILET